MSSTTASTSFAAFGICNVSVSMLASHMLHIIIEEHIGRIEPLVFMLDQLKATKPGPQVPLNAH